MKTTKWLKKVIEEGKVARMKGMLMVDNPYEEDVPEGDAWNLGWLIIDDEENFKEKG